MFNELKIQTAELRRKRLNKLRTYMKAWRESKQYKKFMMASNLTALKYKMTTNNNLLKQCFHALRQHKEDTKLSVMTEAFECNLTPENEELSK